MLNFKFLARPNHKLMWSTALAATLGLAIHGCSGTSVPGIDFPGIDAGFAFPGAPSSSGQAPPPEPLLLESSAVVAGRDAEFLVTGLSPNERAHLFFGRGAGPGPCAPGGSPCLSIRGPVTQLGTAFADASGTASFSVPVPVGAAGFVAWFQAATLLNDFSDATELSNRIRREVTADPCAGVDCGAGSCDVSPQGAAECLCPPGEVADGLSCVSAETAVPCDDTGYLCSYQEYPVPDPIIADGSAEVTADLQSFIDSVPDGTPETPSVIVFPAGSVYWIDGTIRVSNRHHLIFEGSDCRFEARDPITTGGLGQRNRSHWSIQDGSSFIAVKDMTVWGAYPGAGVAGVYDVTREAQHAFSVSGSTTHDILIDNVWAGYVYGDAVDILSGSHDIIIRNSHFEHMARQGFSVSFGYNIKFIGNYIADAKRSLLDLEPYAADWRVDHVQYTNNTFGASGNAAINIVGNTQNVLFFGNEVIGAHGLPLVNSNGDFHESIAFVSNIGEYDNVRRVGVDLIHPLKSISDPLILRHQAT